MSQADNQYEPGFRTSSFSGAGACVAVDLTTHGGVVRVQHSRHPEQGTLVFSAGEWRAFLSGAKAGEFDL